MLFGKKLFYCHFAVEEEENVMQKKPKERIIFDNYDICATFDAAKENLIEQGNEDPSDDEVWEEVYSQENDAWECEKDVLKSIFDNGMFLAVGICGRWNGSFAGGFTFDSWDSLARQLFKDCDYFKFWDENGHFYIQCAHHDGTHSVEIRQLTRKGIEYYDNWNYGPWSDKRFERQIHEKLFEDSHYSHLIHFAHRMYGCPIRETA